MCAQSNISTTHRYVGFAFPVDFRESGLDPDYWGNGMLLTKCRPYPTLLSKDRALHCLYNFTN